LLHAAGAEEAKLLIVAVDESEKTREIVANAQKHFPHLKIIVRTKYWNDYYEMLDRDVLGAYREFSDVGLRKAADALGFMGYRKNQVHRALKKFRKHEEANLIELVKSRHEHKNFIKQGRKVIQELELLIREEVENEAKDKDKGWDTETIIEEYAPLIVKMKQENK
jgi:CPA2 family monovalent cation:H+ antiporter-2